MTHPGIDTATARWLVPLAALCAGVTVANIYLAYPVLPLIAEQFDVGDGAVQFVVTGAQLGYAAGLFLLTPLGDTMRRPRLLATLVVLTAVGLAVAALSASVAMFVVATVCFAFVTVAPHVLIPYIVTIVPPARQGRSLATIGAGMTTGIVLSRVLGGGIGELWGWRALFLLSAVATLAVGLATALALPRETRPRGIPYHRLLWSMLVLLRTEPAIRRAVSVQIPVFATFNLVWVPLVFLLTGPPYGLSVATAGLVGLLSLSTVVAAPFTGRLLERFGSMRVMALGLPVLVGGAIVMLFSAQAIVAVVAGIILLAVGQQAIQIGNQSRVLNASTDSRSRLNTLFMTSNFLGGSCASLAAAYIYSHYGWQGITIGALATALLAGILWIVLEGLPRRRRAAS